MLMEDQPMKKLARFLIPVIIGCLAVLAFCSLPMKAKGAVEPNLMPPAVPFNPRSAWGDPGTGQVSHPAELVTHTLYLPIINKKFGHSPFGIIMYGDISDSAGRQHMAQAGSTIVTTFLHWSAVEPGAPVGGIHNYDWSTYDAKFNAAAEVGMEVFVLFTGNPSWAAELPGGPLYPGRMEDLKAFLSAAVERYDGDGIDDAPGSPRVTYWSFYAEPDNGDLGRALSSGKGYWGHNGAGYAALMAEIYPVIKAANPRARVLIGGLAYAWFEDQDGPFVRDFLPSVLSAMKTSYGRYYIDAFAFHYYPLSVEYATIADKARALRGILSSYGLGDIPMMSPEMGYWSARSLGSSEEKQATRLVQMYTRGLSERLQFMCWYKVFDSDYGHGEVGLFRGQDLNSPKPAYYSYKTLAQQLGGYSLVREISEPGVEGYVFNNAQGDEKTVLWATGLPRIVSFDGAQLHVVDKVGDEVTVDRKILYNLGRPANEVGILVTNSPIYVTVDR
jgi:hypothetical protein